MIVYSKKKSRRLRVMFKKKEFISCIVGCTFFKRIIQKQCFPQKQIKPAKKDSLLFYRFPTNLFLEQENKINLHFFPCEDERPSFHQRDEMPNNRSCGKKKDIRSNTSLKC